MRKLVIAVLAGTLLFASLAISPAHAQDVDDCDDAYFGATVVTVAPTPALAGATVTLAGEGFEPGVTVNLTIERKGGGPPGSQTPIPFDPPPTTAVIVGFGEPDAGTFEVNVTLPTSLVPGGHTIRVISQTCSADQGSVDLTISSAGGGTDVEGGTQSALPASATGVTPVANVQGATQVQSAGALAATGSNRTLSLAGLAVGLLGLGGVFVMTGSRRRARSNSNSA